MNVEYTTYTLADVTDKGRGLLKERTEFYQSLTDISAIESRLYFFRQLLKDLRSAQFF